MVFLAFKTGSNPRDPYTTIASGPWWRREFLQLINNDNKSFIKADFSNISERATSIPEEPENAYDILPQKSKYWPLIQAGTIVDVNDLGKGIDSVAFKWLACYANLRGWDEGRKGKRDELQKYLCHTQQQDVQSDVKNLLDRFKYVVLQGAPGVGKTYNANLIAKNYKEVVFTQFHAETTYTDFIGGLVPDTQKSKKSLSFINKEGILIEAIRRAQANSDSDEKVLLIIDEINRANLANVLGPVFYLFENQATDRCEISLSGVDQLSKLPENLHVLATMNTADRSLAVVDFALRRRFKWYTIRPQAITSQEFDKDKFEAMAQIFRKYATDSELNLQPGPSYFLTGSGADIKINLRYGLLPLIKEYLNEGFLAGSEEDFAAYFRKYADATLFE